MLLIFGLVLRWGLRASRAESPDRFSQLLAAGMTATIFFYIAINMMMVMGLAPVVGHPLALHEPRRLLDDDQHDLRRHADGDRPLARPSFGAVLAGNSQCQDGSTPPDSLPDARKSNIFYIFQYFEKSWKDPLQAPPNNRY